MKTNTDTIYGICVTYGWSALFDQHQVASYGIGPQPGIVRIDQVVKIMAKFVKDGRLVLSDIGCNNDGREFICHRLATSAEILEHKAKND